jgi:hypothetical protein
MEIKLFGKKVFEFKKSGSEMLIYNSNQALEKSKFLPDFHTMRENYDSNWGIGMSTEGSIMSASKGKGKNIKEEKKTPDLTPKNVFEMKLLNDDAFKINVDPAYIEEQLNDFKDKLNLIKITEFDMSRGTNEISSFIVRLENRKQYKKYHKFFDEYAYTTTAKINGVVKQHSNLKLGKVEQFIADLPKEAITSMKDYTKTTEQICGKKPIFYIIADKKDFEKSDQRRDPILLAQSPFGHFWQILGAWDEEMMFLEEL